MSDVSLADEEQSLRMELMRADIDLKRAQMQWEPWKAIATAVTASAAVFGTLGAVIGFLAAHYGAR